MGDDQARLQPLRWILDDEAQIDRIGGVTSFGKQIGYLLNIGFDSDSQVVSASQLRNRSATGRGGCELAADVDQGESLDGSCYRPTDPAAD